MALQLLEQMPQQRMETDLVAWTPGDDSGTLGEWMTWRRATADAVGGWGFLKIEVAQKSQKHGF